MKCRICGNDKLTDIIDLGKTPLANSYPAKEDLAKEEPQFPLGLKFCNQCKLLQLNYVVPPELMFSHYLYVTSTTETFRKHFGEMAENISKEYKLRKGSLVVDIGSNDGLLLSGFKKHGAAVVGVEPASNVAEIAEKNGIPTIVDYFNDASVQKILDKYGPADVVTATNVFAHTDDIALIARNVKKLLKKDGMFVIEAAYMVDMLKDMTFDAIYHEHVSYYSLTPLIKFFELEDMRVFDVKHVDSHGGSLRVFAKKKEGSFPLSENVSTMLSDEELFGVNDAQTYLNFAGRIQEVKKKLNGYVNNLKKEGKKIAGYGAPAKTTTLLHYCELNNSHIDYIVDDNPLKAGRYMPGSHIPLVSSDRLDTDPPDYIMILAWNFADEIIKKTKKYSDKGVKFIIPLPEPKIV